MLTINTVNKIQKLVNTTKDPIILKIRIRQIFKYSIYDIEFVDVMGYYIKLKLYDKKNNTQLLEFFSINKIRNFKIQKILKRII